MILRIAKATFPIMHVSARRRSVIHSVYVWDGHRMTKRGTLVTATTLYTRLYSWCLYDDADVIDVATSATDHRARRDVTFTRSLSLRL